MSEPPCSRAWRSSIRGGSGSPSLCLCWGGARCQGGSRPVAGCAAPLQVLLRRRAVRMRGLAPVSHEDARPSSTASPPASDPTFSPELCRRRGPCSLCGLFEAIFLWPTGLTFTVDRAYNDVEARRQGLGARALSSFRETTVRSSLG